jgi:hypothetical protein
VALWEKARAGWRTTYCTVETSKEKEKEKMFYKCGETDKQEQKLLAFGVTSVSDKGKLTPEFHTLSY